MTTDQIKFIASVLGSDGCKALTKAVDRCQALESVLIPRSILSWINTVSNIGYEGTVPGVDNSYLTFEKSEDGFNGSVSMGEYMYNFEKSNLFHISSAIALSLGIEPNQDINVKDLDIEKLGKSIDLLVKAKVVTNEMLLKPKAKEELEKDGKEAPGGAAGAIEPVPAMAPMPTAAQSVKMTEKPKMPKLPKPSRIKVSKSETSHKCSLCNRASFIENTYVGCYCMSELAKSVKTEGEYLILGADWDSDAILSLYESLGRND